MFSYRVKAVRGKDNFLWGGADMKVNGMLDLALAIRVDENGEDVTIFSLDHDGVPLQRNKKGKLLRGETFTISLKDIGGVAVTCEEDTFLTCSIFWPK